MNTDYFLPLPEMMLVPVPAICGGTCCIGNDGIPVRVVLNTHGSCFYCQSDAVHPVVPSAIEVFKLQRENMMMREELERLRKQDGLFSHKRAEMKICAVGL